MTTQQWTAGEKIRITVQVRDNNNELYDPAVLKLKIRRPGTTAVDTFEYGEDAALERDELGIFHCDVQLNSAGFHAYRWEADGAVSETRFNVNPSHVS